MCITVSIYSTAYNSTEKHISPNHFLSVGGNTADNILITILTTDF